MNENTRLAVYLILSAPLPIFLLFTIWLSDYDFESLRKRMKKLKEAIKEAVITATTKQVENHQWLIPCRLTAKAVYHNETRSSSLEL